MGFYSALHQLSLQSFYIATLHEGERIENDPLWCKELSFLHSFPLCNSDILIFFLSATKGRQGIVNANRTAVRTGETLRAASLRRCAHHDHPRKTDAARLLFNQAYNVFFASLSAVELRQKFTRSANNGPNLNRPPLLWGKFIYLFIVTNDHMTHVLVYGETFCYAGKFQYLNLGLL